MTNSDQQYSTMTKGKKDKMTNSDQQYSTMAKGKKGQNDKQLSAIQHNGQRADHCFSILSFFSFGHCAVLLITVCLFCPCFPLVIVLYW
jgi:hypothetical protein